MRFLCVSKVLTIYSETLVTTSTKQATKTTTSTTTFTTTSTTTTTTTQLACDSDVEVSMRATSGESFRCGSEYWTGNEIELLQNDHVVGIFPAGFEDFHICILRDQVDIENDIFELRRTGTDGVCSFTTVLYMIHGL